MVTKSKKAPTKKAQTTNIKPKTIGILAGLAAAFCALDEIFAIIWWGEVDWLETCILIGIALSSIFLYSAYKKKNQRSVDVLAGAVIILALVYHIVYLSYVLPFLLPIFGIIALPTLAITLDIAILVTLVFFVCAYFVGMNKNGKKAVAANKCLSIVISAIAACAMIVSLITTVKMSTFVEEDNLPAVEIMDTLPESDIKEISSSIETTRFAILGESLSYYAMIIAVIILVQKSQKA